MDTESACPAKKSQTLSGSPAVRLVNHLTKNTYAMVLADSRGSSLHQLTDRRAKSALPFGGKFRIIDFALSNCVNSGIHRIGVATQYKSNSLIKHVQRGWSALSSRFAKCIDLLPAQQRVNETHWYHGTADSVYQNLDILRINNPEFVLILAGAHVYKMDYGKLLAFHVENKADVTMAYLEMPTVGASTFGVLSIDENARVVEFSKNPAETLFNPGIPGTALTSMGIYVFNAKFLFEQMVRDADDLHSSHDFANDLIPQLIEKNRVFAHNFSQSCVGMSNDNLPYWRDVDTVDAYWEVNMELTKVVPRLNLYDREWPIWTRQGHLAPAKFVFDNNERRGMAIDSLVSEGCIVSGSTVRRSLLFSDVRVNCYCEIEDSVLLPNVNVGLNVTLKRVIVDKNCNIPEGLEVGVNPEKDRSHFHVTPNGVTLITRDMLKKMQEEHPLPGGR